MAINDSTQGADDLDLDALANFGPAIDRETVEIAEKNASSQERGQQRRLCLTACSSSADVLSNLSIESPEAFTEMIECIEEFAEHTKWLHEMATAAQARMIVADCRRAT